MTASADAPRRAGGLERLGSRGTAEILAVAARDGTRAATERALQRDPGLLRLLATTGRADWRFHLPTHPRERAVVVGSGLGGMSFDLAEDYREVVSCEASEAARAWQAYRADEDRVRNVRIVAMDHDAVSLPDECADVVALDRGVVIGRDTVAELRPFLLEARRLLKAGGWLYWGFENRNGQFRLGPSSGGDAEAALRLTPSRARRTAAALGYRDIALYWVRPSCEEQVASAPLGDRRMILEFLRARRRSGVAGAIRSFGEQALARTGLLSLVVPHVFLLARRGERLGEMP